MSFKTDEYYMGVALELAEQAAQREEVPVGAVLVDETGEIIGQGMNGPITMNDPTAHAEINAIRQASNLKSNYRLPNTRLYVTIEPCCMCFGAIIHARVSALIYGAPEPRAGAVTSGLDLAQATCFNHKVSIRSGVLEQDARQMIQEFFQQKRQKSNHEV